MMTGRSHSLWQRCLAACLAVAVGVLPLAGCGTASRTPERTSIHVVAVVIDEQRLAGPGDADALRIWRNGAWTAAPAGTTLQSGDRVQVARNATAVIRWPGLGDAYLRPDSTGTIGSLDDWVGTVLLKVRGAFAVRTRLVASLSKGTVFLARGMPDGTLTITVLESAVEMSSRNGAWASRTLNAGETGTGGLRAPVPQQASAAEMQATRDWAERIERLLPRTTGANGSGAATAAAIGIGAVIAAILLSRDSKRESAPPGASTSPDRPAGTAGVTGSNMSTQPPVSATVPLAAATQLSPGSTNERSPALSTCNPSVQVSWAAVPGAQQYETLIEARATGQGWRTVGQPRTSTTSADGGRADFASLYRFSVRAMSGARSGPWAGPVYFMCNNLR